MKYSHVKMVLIVIFQMLSLLLSPQGDVISNTDDSCIHTHDKSRHGAAMGHVLTHHISDMNWKGQTETPFLHKKSPT